MSDYQMHARDYSEFDDMSTEELEKVLRQEFLEENNEENDVDATLRILEVIVKRKRAESPDNIPDIQTAWKDFQTKYMPAAGLSFEDDVPEKESGLEKSLFRKKSVTPKKNPKFVRNIRYAAAVFVVVVLFAGYGAYAKNGNLWDSIVQWSKDVFSLSRNSSIGVPSEVQSLLAEHGLFDEYIPTWLPEGYEYKEAKIIEESAQTTLFFTYTDGVSNIVISINNLSGILSTSYEKDTSKIEIYSKNNITHYIMDNYNLTKIAWINGDCECYITGAFSLNDAKKMIDSIYGD